MERPTGREEQKEAAMFLCRICRFATELDDIAVAGASGGCVCLRCFGRATDTLRPMPRALRRALSAALAAAEAA
jgi:hypothetical protein